MEPDEGVEPEPPAALERLALGVGNVFSPPPGGDDEDKGSKKTTGSFDAGLPLGRNRAARHGTDAGDPVVRDRGHLEVPSGHGIVPRLIVTELAGPVRRLFSVGPASYTDTITIVVVDCRGVLIGDGGKQYNDLRYHVKQPIIKVEGLLLRADVQAALRLLIADPDDDSARGAAVTAMTSAAPTAWQRRSPLLLPDGLGNPTLRRGPQPGTEVFVIGSQGVQAGHGGVQRTRFLYSVSPTLDTAALLASRPGLARALVQHVVDGGTAAEQEMSVVLADAVRHAVLRAAAERSDSGVALPTPGPGCLLRLVATDAVAVGASQNNIVSVTVDRAKARLPALLNFVPLGPNQAKSHLSVAPAVPPLRRGGQTRKAGAPSPEGRGSGGLGRG